MEGGGKVGIYLGKPPDHCRHVSLVMSLAKIIATPQFHLKYNLSFDVAKQDSSKSS